MFLLDRGYFYSPSWAGLGGNKLTKNLGANNMKNQPIGISVIYFTDESKNIYADLPIDKEQAKMLSKRIYRNAMTALSTERSADAPQALSCGG